MDGNELGFGPVRKWKLWRGAHWASPALSWLRLSRSAGLGDGRSRTSILDDPALWEDPSSLLAQLSAAADLSSAASGHEKSSGSSAKRSSGVGGHRPLFSKPRPLPELLRNPPPEVPSAPLPVESAEANPAEAPLRPVPVKEELDEEGFDLTDLKDQEIEALLGPPEFAEGHIKQEDGELAAKGRKRKVSQPESKARLKKPRLPQFAFEIFKQEFLLKEEAEEQQAKSSKEGSSLVELVQHWKELKEEELRRYIAMADQDRHRFEREYEEWRQKRAAAGKDEEALEDLLEKRRAMLENSLARVSSAESKAKRQKTRRPNAKPPDNFPKRPAMTAYALFCQEHKARIAGNLPTDADSKPSSAEGAAAAEAAEQEHDAAEPVQAQGKRKGLAVLAELKKAWGQLSREDVRAYATRAAEDQQRFRRELEEWQADPANEGALEQSVVQDALKLANKAIGKPKLPRPNPREADILDRVAPGRDSMWGTLTELQLLSAEGKKQRAAADAAIARQQLETPAPFAQVAAPLPREEEEPAAAVDDLLGDLLSVEADLAQASREAAFDSAEGNSGFGMPLGGQFADIEEAGGQAHSLGPQLCLDESGNIVLNQSSLSRNLSHAENPIHEGAAGVQEAVSQYTSAYKRTPACKWTLHETQMFYEALSLYGTDLFLVQTFFRNKSAGQIKTKYSKELKKNPQKVEEALTTRSRKLTKDTFEKLHGKIDTSKHYKPPATPEPGENPEPDGRVPEEEEDDLGDLGGMPPPEPEYSAEDESLTTNRLMALFD